MNPSLGVTIEALVAILLVLTIGYCMLLNARLKRLKADEHSLKATIAELITATEIAERAIGGLKHTVRDVNENLGSQLASAAQMAEHLKRQLAEGDHVVRRLTKIAIAARPSQAAEAEAKEPASRDFAARDFAPTGAAAKPSNAQALAAAAQAFSERRRTGGLAA
jgi:chromosome segregation ATPase